MLHDCLLKIVVYVCPCIDNLVVTLVIGNETHIVVIGNLVNLSLTLVDNLDLLGRNDNIVKVEGESCKIGHAVTKVLNTIKERACA